MLAGLMVFVIELVVSVPQQLGPITLPLITGPWVWLSFVGYLFAPMLVIVAFGRDRILQRRAAVHPNFAPRRDYSRTLRILAIVSWLLGIWHVVNIAYAIASLIADGAAA
ncbi:hypothetical protein [Agromyces sp. Marseille-Q5079]|uniref:hypothetical protein n=1 Tax=Agromyces sp. Marseille-Q5079 TaxID=3439059 RepID=UPI003D9C9B71